MDSAEPFQSILNPYLTRNARNVCLWQLPAVTGDWHQTLLTEMSCLFLTGFFVGAHVTEVSVTDVFLILGRRTSGK